MRKNYIVPLVMSTLLFSSCTKGITDDRTNDTTVTTMVYEAGLSRSTEFSAASPTSRTL
ncbi:MAG: hypothetical protein J6X56_09975 [Ruminococcus sp.]|nr:hypothetical protein [Ruminococcus sp.]